jgi:hypothetical protein
MVDSRNVLLIGLLNEFVEVSEKLRFYKTRVPFQLWDSHVMKKYTDEMKEITLQFKKIKDKVYSGFMPNATSPVHAGKDHR